MTNETSSSTKGPPLQTLMAVQMLLNLCMCSSLLNRKLSFFAKRAKNRGHHQACRFLFSRRHWKPKVSRRTCRRCGSQGVSWVTDVCSHWELWNLPEDSSCRMSLFKNSKYFLPMKPMFLFSFGKSMSLWQVGKFLSQSGTLQQTNMAMENHHVQ